MSDRKPAHKDGPCPCDHCREMRRLQRMVKPLKPRDRRYVIEMHERMVMAEMKAETSGKGEN